jgi:hypothetical protein
MPTCDVLASFWRDWDDLSPDEQSAFLDELRKFIADLQAGKGFRKGLRVKGVKGARGVYEMTWAPDGRATFQYGRAVKGDDPHIIWRRIGGHGIFRNP